MKGSVLADKVIGRQNGIVLETPKRTFYMCADSHEEKMDWMEALRDAGALVK